MDLRPRALVARFADPRALRALALAALLVMAWAAPAPGSGGAQEDSASRPRQTGIRCLVVILKRAGEGSVGTGLTSRPRAITIGRPDRWPSAPPRAGPRRTIRLPGVPSALQGRIPGQGGLFLRGGRSLLRGLACPLGAALLARSGGGRRVTATGTTRVETAFAEE